MTKPLDAKKIKSASRVLEVFEFFSARRQQATVMEIAREYGYPQSSTSELLSCLVELGFLHRDRRARTYRPTARVAVLGSWVQPRLFRNGSLLPMMDELSEQSERPVMLAGVIGTAVQVFQAVGADANLSPGTNIDLLHSAIGKLLLTSCERQYIRKMVHRLNAESRPEDWVRCEDLLLELDRLRSQGYAYAPPSDHAPGMCVVLLPQPLNEDPLALALVVGDEDEISVQHHVRSLRNAVARHLGPTVASRRPAAVVPQPQLRHA
jgi:DNA-binding IclR family transcriptional regulator